MKELFELDPSVIYLNCASMSPLLRSAREASLKSLDARATPWTMTSADWFEDSETLRELVAKVYQTSADNIAFGTSVSYGMATVARNVKLKKGQSIVILDKQFPSNVYAWEKLAEQQSLNVKRVVREQGSSLTQAVLNAIDSDAGLVAIPNCHWMNGHYVDLEQVSKKAKSAGALLVVDLSQSLGALPANIEAIDPDFAVAAGYKWMFGVYGLSYMYIAPRWQQPWEPLENSWVTRERSEDFSRLTEYTWKYKPGARKFDMGEYMMLSTRALAIAGAKQILSWGVDDVQSRISELTKIVKDYNHAQGIEPVESVGHIASISFGDRDVAKIKNAIASRKINVSYRDTFIRVSPHIYNSAEEVKILIDCVERA